jgi:hypothetical protein
MSCSTFETDQRLGWGNIDVATARTHLMTISATGFKVRFFKMKTATGLL